MPRVITTDPANLTQGHCWPSTKPDIPKILGKRTPTVFIHNHAVVLVGDPFNEALHTGCTTPTPTTHPVIPIAGSPTVFVNGIALVRDGDPMGCGDVANGGDFTVFADGGGSKQGGDPDNTIGFTRSRPELEYPGISINIPYWVYLQLGEEIFGGGCEFTFPLLDAYTPLTEENGTVYRNRPGLPLTQRSGAQLPPYANQINTNPIDITIGSIGLFPPNISFYEDGSIRGRVLTPFDIDLFQGEKIKIVATNHVGSKTFELSFNFQKNYNRCP